MSNIEPHQRHPLHSTAAILESAFRHIVAEKPASAASAAPPALRPVVIYGLSDARAAAEMASEQGGQELALLSPAGIAHSLGPQWFMALVRQVQATADDLKIIGILNCGRYEGHVMAALQCGFRDVYFTGDADMAEKLAVMAAGQGARLHRAFAEVLDLKTQGDQLAACRNWFDKQARKTG